MQAQTLNNDWRPKIVIDGPRTCAIFRGPKSCKIITLHPITIPCLEAQTFNHKQRPKIVIANWYSPLKPKLCKYWLRAISSVNGPKSYVNGPVFQRAQIFNWWAEISADRPKSSGNGPKFPSIGPNLLLMGRSPVNGPILSQWVDWFGHMSFSNGQDFTWWTQVSVNRPSVLQMGRPFILIGSNFWQRAQIIC